MRLIDADALDAEMYHKSFEVDDGRNVWNSGLWIRYKIFEEAIRDAPTIDAVTVADIIEVEKERNYWHDLADSYERTILKLTKALEEANRGRREHETD